MADQVYQKLKQHFTDKDVTFHEIQHEPGASAEDYHKAVGCRYEQQAKCLLIKIYTDSGDRFVILTIPAQKRADLEQVKTLMNAKKARMATREELKEVTGCDYGEVPPTGSVFGIKLLMDKDLLNEQEIFMNAGRVDVSFVINPKDLQKAEEPILL